MSNELDAWPGGETWVFQGTVAEDGTGGTHVCSLTVTPGAGNEMTFEYATILAGNTATAQTMQCFIDDGTNTISLFGSVVDTLASIQRVYPHIAVDVANTNNFSLIVSHVVVSGTMRLVLKVTTAAISVTQTFAVACRIKGAMPTATLADTVGTPVLTVNTNKVF